MANTNYDLDLIAVLISASALVFSVLANKRSHKASQGIADAEAKLAKELAAAEEKLSRELAAAEVKPLLKIETSSETTRVSVVVKNYGNGTAVVTSAKFARGLMEANNLVDVLGVDSRKWPTYYGFPTGETYLEAQGSLRLAELTSDFLSKQNQPQTALEQMRRNLNDVSIEFYYTDVFGHSVFEEKAVMNIDFAPYSQTESDS